MKFNFDNFLAGHELYAYQYFGAHRFKKDGVNGIIFRTYAPNAQEVHLIGEFNNWGQQEIKLEKVHPYGVFEVFVPKVQEYMMYKYLIKTNNGESIEKMDPYEFFHEMRPGSASKVFFQKRFPWTDQKYMQKMNTSLNKPVSVFEVHLGSFKKPRDKEYYSYEELIDILVPYVKKYGYTHVEFMPITYHPFDGSWGYQGLGFFSVDSRLGNPTQLKMLIDALHRENIGVIFDFVPLHFALDAYGIIKYDGGTVFEYSDDRQISPWGSVQFDLGKDPVRSFLMSSINYFFKVFHFDGVRIDAVSNIIYYNGDKTRGVNEGAHEFIKRANLLLKQENPKVMLIAEDSSDFYGVTKKVEEGGLGFDYKWDLGWMNDTLEYYESDTLFRGDIHGKLPFSMVYFYNEHFILPLSHDEVVHGKASVLNKMFGGYNERFAQTRNLYVYQFLHPGKKLNFMGNELAVWDEWNPERQFPDVFETVPLHLGVRELIKDLNQLYRNEPALHVGEYKRHNFAWLREFDADECVYVFQRIYRDERIIAVFNMSPTERLNYRVEIKDTGDLREILNSTNEKYMGNTPKTKIGKKHGIFKNKGDANFPYNFKIHLRPYMAAVYKLKVKKN